MTFFLTPDGLVPATDPPGADEPRALVGAFFPLDVHAPVLFDGGDRYPHGSSIPLWLPITGSVPSRVEVDTGDGWAEARVLPADGIPGPLLMLLGRRARGQVLAAALVTGSAGWPQGVLRLHVRVTGPGGELLRSFRLPVSR